MEARGGDEASEPRDLGSSDLLRLQESFPPEVPDRLRDPGPGGLRHQYRADEDLERGIGGPPALGAMVGEESVEDLARAHHQTEYV